MKQEIHAKMYPILYVDGTHTWTGVSTMTTNEIREVEGVNHYVVHVDISAYTHPFYTGQKKIVDSAGRVEKFMRRYGNQEKKGK
jgi:large subunit ribosomal protein L31